MNCKKCNGTLRILRICRKIRMQCEDCGQEYRIHEVADQLDHETEYILEQYNVIIYD
ncbi:MAG: dual CXXC motif small (seleno)protein [Desulfobulbales bacterium]